jgi:hypothetical protein
VYRVLPRAASGNWSAMAVTLRPANALLGAAARRAAVLLGNRGGLATAGAVAPNRSLCADVDRICR